MRRFFVTLFLAVFLVSSVFNVSGAVAQDTFDQQSERSISIKQVSFDPLELKIEVNPHSDDLLYQVWGKDANGWVLVSPYSEIFCHLESNCKKGRYILCAGKD